MCISYGLTTCGESLRRAFELTDIRLGDAWQPLELCPDELAPVIRTSGSSRVAEPMRWGLPPNPKSDRPTSAISEPDSPYWRRWLLQRGYRCLVPATRFSVHGGRAGTRREHGFTIAGERPLCAFAGVWRPWRGSRAGVEGEHLLFALLVCKPNQLVASVRGRSMPVVMTASEEFDVWLHAPWEVARDLVRPCPTESMALDS